MTAPDGGGADPLATLGRLARALESYGVKEVAVTGAAALGHWATPRQSHDIDLCAYVPREAVAPILARFDGVSVGPGDLPSVLRLRFLDWDVDVFVSTDDPYDRACMDRAVEVGAGATRVRVVTAEDLLIHKLFKLRTDRRRVLQDLQDMRSLALARGASLDRDYLRRWLPSDEADLLDALVSASDEDLARRVLGR